MGPAAIASASTASGSSADPRPRVPRLQAIDRECLAQLAIDDGALWCGSGVGAVGGAVGAGPQVAAVGAALVGPAGEGLQPVMPPTEAGEVRSSRLPRRAPVIGRHVGLHVVQVATAGVDGAAGEHAVPVAEDDL